jgi:hypothetical protein
MYHDVLYRVSLMAMFAQAAGQQQVWVRGAECRCTGDSCIGMEDPWRADSAPSPGAHAAYWPRGGRVRWAYPVRRCRSQ